jgi:hypothetical protein
MLTYATAPPQIRTLNIASKGDVTRGGFRAVSRRRGASDPSPLLPGCGVGFAHMLLLPES